MKDVQQRGQKLRELREAAGLSQAQVGAEFGVSKQAVSEWENGKGRPDVHKLRKLDDLYAAGGRVLDAFDLGSSEVSQLRDEVARLAQAVDQIAHVLGVTLTDDDGPQRSTGAARPAGEARRSSP